jgi:hypothetical protein
VEELKAEMNLPFNLCPDCLMCAQVGEKKRQYLYGLCEKPRRQPVDRESELEAVEAA